jgi:hypothetical protein
MFRVLSRTFLLMMVSCLGCLWADDTSVNPTPAPTLTSSGLELEKTKLEIEKLQLENEKLKLEMDKMRFQATLTPGSGNSSENHDNGPKKDEKIAAYLEDETKKAQELAAQNKDKDDLLIVDFVNAEGWYKGVRYGLHDFYTLAADRKWAISKKVDERKSTGVARNLYGIKNFSLLRYEDKDRGIIEMTPPLKEGDLRILTSEGISFDSSADDVRNAFQNIYFKYEGQDSRDGFKVIRYEHGRGLSFSDKLEVWIDIEGKIKTIRFGVLDEK